jgi:hypothetical protein
MKQTLLLVLSVILLGSSCKKQKPVNPVDQLPPETQTGANTFGCLVNGQIFKPGGAQLSGGSLQCNYQLVNGAYHFTLIGRFQNNSNGTGGSIGLYTDSLSVHQGDKLSLKAKIKGNPSADYFKAINSYQYELFNTDDLSYLGELWIKKLDSVNQIVSGTFWFNAVNSNGDTVKITEGRFDVHYTK